MLFQAVTRLGQKIVDIEVTDAILPEVLRVFMVARNGRDTEVQCQCLFLIIIDTEK